MTVEPVQTDAFPHGLPRAFIIVSIFFASVMQSLDNTIANVAIPHMQGSLGAAQEEMAWVLTSYIIASGVMIPLTGWLSGQFGRKRLFLTAVAGFTLASLLCSLSQTLPQITLFRVLQGVFGAPLVPLTHAVLLDITPRSLQGRALAVLQACVSVAPIFGPLVGGWLTEEFDWRWVFLINLPFGLFAFAGLLIYLAERSVLKPRFDFPGFVALGMAIAALQLMLERGSLQGWFDSTEIWIEATVLLVALYIFIVHTLTATHSIIPVAILKDRNLVVGCVFQFIFAGTFLATISLLPPMVQNLLQYPTFTSGVLTAPRGFGQVIATFAVGRLVSRFDVRLLTAVGFVLITFSLWQMSSFSLLMDRHPIVQSSFIQGIGAGIAYTPLMVVAFTSIAPQLRTEATALFNLMRTIGGSIGIAGVQEILARNTQIVHAALAAHVTRFNIERVIGGHDGMSEAAALVALNKAVTEQASMVAYNDDFLVMMFASAAAMLVLLFARPAPSRDG